MSHQDDPLLQTPRPGKGASKVARIPVKVTPVDAPLPKPNWIRARSPNHPEVLRVKQILRTQQLHTVCEEAACPNLGECFASGTATFMIMGGICTRRCPFCDVAHGRPDPLDPKEPQHLAETIRQLGLGYVVITSVDRDDLRDGGASHFADCIAAVRSASPATRIEILTPDFRGRESQALGILAQNPPDVFNHNLETVPRLYPAARPGADYYGSLRLLQAFREHCHDVPTKSGLMLGLGEEDEEILAVMQDLRTHGCVHLTLGQYLAPSAHHLPVQRYVSPQRFDEFAQIAREMGFERVASGPMVRSSYHAEHQ